MITLRQCYKNSTTVMGDVDNVGGYAFVGAEVCREPLHLSLIFAVYQKLL